MKANIQNASPLLTVITVVYQAEKEILTTLENLENQTYCAFEYIIIDGKSKDQTVQNIRKFLPKIEEKGIKTIFVSEKDTGIYDAMNKGVQKASGEWIAFLNAGDIYYENITLQKVADILRNEDCDVVHGNEYWNEPNNGYIAESNSSEDLPEGKVLFHPSSFVKRELLLHNPFSLEYKIASDYEFFLRIQQKGHTFHKIPNVIASFAYGGVSSVNPLICIRETTKIRKKYNCFCLTKKELFKEYLPAYLVVLIKSIIPRSLDLRIVEWKKKVKKSIGK